MLEKDTMLGLIKSAVNEELRLNSNICGKFDNEDLESILNIMEIEKLNIKESIYKHIKKSDNWLYVFDEPSAYNDYGIVQGRCGNLKRSDYEIYLKKGYKYI